MSMTNTAIGIVEWLKTSIVNTNYGKFVRERFRVSDKTWYEVYRSDCNIESAYAFLLAWKHTGERQYLQLARELYAGVKALQQEDGSVWRRTDSDTCYVSGCSKVAVNLFRMAEVDTEYADEYRETAIKVTDWLITIQNNEGGFPRSTTHASYTACFTAHAVSAFSMAYRYTTRQSVYLEAIEKAVAFIVGKVRNDNMITLMGASEAQRPPSSDQGIVIRGLAQVELYVPDLELAAACRTVRLRLLSWFVPLLTDEGALRNGYGTGANGADVATITDYVYSVPFAVEAFYYSAIVDGDKANLINAMKLVRFAQGNVYYSEHAELNGVLRGAFELENRNWNTGAAAIDSGEQGGGDMIYTGWTNAPMAMHFFNFSSAVGSGTALSIETDAKTERFLPDGNGTIRICVEGNAVKFPTVNGESVSASAVKLFANGEKLALAHLL
jgi:hypothetical protein